MQSIKNTELSLHPSPREKTRHTKMAWLVTWTASLFFFYEFIQMNFFNAINAQLREAYHLNAVQIGQLFSMYFYANFLCLFPAGNIIDRFSTRKLLLFAMTLCTTGTLFFAIANTYWLAALGRFMEGMGASFCFLSCLRIASRWFPPQRMAFVTGVAVTMAMLGGLIAQAPFAALVEYLGGNWRQALFINTGLGVVIGFAIYFIVQDHPPDAQQAAKVEQAQLKQLGLWQSIKLAMLNPQNWLGGCYTALVNLPVFIIGGLWGILYLTQAYHFTTVQASYATTFFFVGVVLGSPAYGWFSDYIGRRVLPMTIGALLSLLVMLALLYIPGLSLSMIVFLFFLIGFVTSSQVLTYPALAELNPIYLTSTAVSIDSLCIMASGFIVPPAFGWLMERGGPHQLVNGAAVYTAQDFKLAMLIMPVALLIGLLITALMRETYCQSQA